jgi:hypothetical protein
MAENQPPANAPPPPDTPFQDRSIVRATLGNANGNRGRPELAKSEEEPVPLTDIFGIGPI